MKINRSIQTHLVIDSHCCFPFPRYLFVIIIIILIDIVMDHHFLCDPEVKDGYTFIPWIADIFGDCVYTPTDKLSFGFGTLSLLLFILSYYPQLKRNWERKNVEGLSLGLLMLWYE